MFFLHSKFLYEGTFWAIRVQSAFGFEHYDFYFRHFAFFSVSYAVFASLKKVTVDQLSNLLKELIFTKIKKIPSVFCWSSTSFLSWVKRRAASFNFSPKNKFTFCNSFSISWKNTSDPFLKCLAISVSSTESKNKILIEPYFVLKFLT